MLQASVDHRKFLVNRTLAEKGHTVNHNAKNELKKRKKEKKEKKWGEKKVPLVEFMYLVFLYLHTCQVRVTVGDSGLCCCTCDTYF